MKRKSSNSGFVTLLQTIEQRKYVSNVVCRLDINRIRRTSSEGSKRDELSEPLFCSQENRSGKKKRQLGVYGEEYVSRILFCGYR